MNFRYDINGLRAIAVLAVVIFHFNPQWLPGGFAGVDVFFVISGFLMTSIIFNGVEKNTFNLFKFYNARANRIIPVLAAMSAVLLVFGWFYLIPPDYRDLGKQVEKSSLFISNLLFAKGGGYFDTAEHTKWLLHTWSLSVEWQFYIFFPVIIIALKKYISFSNLKRVVIGLFLASFIYCIYATFKDSKTAYFLLTSRAWEMLLGGLAFLYPWTLKNKSHQITTQCLGIILIIASYFLISKDTPWPGYMGLIPVFGAYLIVVSNFQNNVILNNPLISNIGKWSYSIYVWHWPLVVFGFYFALANWWMYGIPLSIFLGFVSYQFIEKVNFPRYSSWSEIYKVKPFYIFLIILACGYAVKKTNGMEFHYPQIILNALAEEVNYNKQCQYLMQTRKVEQCVIGNPLQVKAVIIGDSHAEALATSVTSIIDLKKYSIVLIAASRCPLLSDTQIKHPEFNDDCSKLNKKRMEIIKSKYKDIPIILISRLSHYIEGQNDPERVLDVKGPLIFFSDRPENSKEQLYSLFSSDLHKTLCSLSKSNPVYIMQPTPEIPFNVPRTIMKNYILKKDTNTLYTYTEYLERSQKMRIIVEKNSVSCSAKVLDPAPILCKKNRCITTYKNRSIYRDGDHLSEYGNKLLVPMFKEALQQ